MAPAKKSARMVLMPCFKINILALLLHLALLCAEANASIIINGDFENNSANTTLFNLLNSGFNSTVANATAFGSASEIDLMLGNPIGSPPQSGNWTLGIHTQNNGTFDAFSFNLSSQVVDSQTYILDFYAQSILNFGFNIGAVQVGLSNSATSFGILIFSGTPLTTSSGWTHFHSVFVAPQDGLFLTVQQDPNTLSAWNHIDNFSLVSAVPEPSSIAFTLIGAIWSAACAVSVRRRTKTAPA